jgi:hypothetical protein
MAQIPPYTSTYTDVDHSVMDADDLVNEFWRVSDFFNLWSGIIDPITEDNVFEIFITLTTGELAEILPARGLIQRIEVDPDVETFEIAVREHTTGAPFRIFIVVRCGNPDTRFFVTAPSGQSHIFGINRSIYMPGQVIGDGFYNASLILTYGAEKGVMIQVHAANPEEGEVSFDDVMTAVPK